MLESLRPVLSLLDSLDQPVWQQYQIAEWPAGDLDRWREAGLLVPAEPAQQVMCSDCDETVDVEIVTGGVPRQTMALLLCGQCGPHRVPLEWVAQWRLDLEIFLDRLCNALRAQGERTVVVPGRVWRLGRCRWAEASRSVYFARRLARSDAYEVVQRADFPAGAVLLVPRSSPRPEQRIEPLPPVFSLTDVLSWEGEGWEFDHVYVEDQLRSFRSERAVRGEREPVVTKRGSRLDVIERLQQELAEHLRAARDYARTTRQRTGTPELLPRPTLELLAKQLGVHRTTVRRCLEDESARELRLLWEVAADLDRIVGQRS